MANTNLNSDVILLEALRVFHQKTTFLGRINRQYDSNFANEGAKIGSNLRIRLPAQFVVRTGAPIDVQNYVERSETLSVTTQKGVDTTFTSEDLSMDIDRFSQRVLDPAMSVLVAVLEANALQTMTLEVPNLIDNDSNTLTLKNILDARASLQDNLAPSGDLTALISTASSADLVDALKGLFQSSEKIKEQYEQGSMGFAAGFEHFVSTHVANHTTGTAAEGDTSYNVDGTTESGSAITVDGGTTTFLKGDIITFAGTNSVQEETKVSTGVLKQFVITAASGASATSLAISPEMVVSGARQNVSGSPTDNGAVSKIGAGNGELLTGNLCFHKDAFIFATADLLLPSGVDMASRNNFEGVAMRLVRAYDINNDQFPVRFDTMSGFLTSREGRTAVRIHADG